MRKRQDRTRRFSLYKTVNMDVSHGGAPSELVEHMARRRGEPPSKFIRVAAVSAAVDACRNLGLRLEPREAEGADIGE